MLYRAYFARFLQNALRKTSCVGTKVDFSLLRVCYLLPTYRESGIADVNVRFSQSLHQECPAHYCADSSFGYVPSRVSSFEGAGRSHTERLLCETPYDGSL
jgi:hypothetical protein